MHGHSYILEPEFDEEPHWKLLKELIIQTFGTPNNHPKSCRQDKSSSKKSYQADYFVVYFKNKNNLWNNVSCGDFSNAYLRFLTVSRKVNHSLCMYMVFLHLLQLLVLCHVNSAIHI